MGKSLILKCVRCGGAMFPDQFRDTSERFWGYKCLFCGEIIDPLILENRRLMSTGQGVPLPREIQRSYKLCS
ncbi:MAG: hypothetical protein LLG93_04490 [Deltaproteobacteria bacterium]|jgi:hypothetical protein|nr:hypothetical protein [Deltaproteobacteria bacterium]